MGLFSDNYVFNNYEHHSAPSMFGITNATNRVADKVDKLNDTFYSEFNERQKRAINISLLSEDDEPLKYSDYFNQAPIFKEKLKNSFYSKSRSEMSDVVYKNIDKFSNEPVAIRACEVLKSLSETLNPETPGNTYLPKILYKLAFENRPTNCINTEFTKESLMKLKENILLEFSKYKSEYPKDSLNTLVGLNVDFELMWLRDWELTDKSIENFNRLENFVSPKRKEFQESLLSYQEREMAKTIKDFIKDDVTVETTEVDAKGNFAYYTLNNTNKKPAYLLVKLAPNVNVNAGDN